jgi:hypothetical protein
MTIRRFLSTLGLSLLVCTVGPVARLAGQSTRVPETTVQVDGVSVAIQSIGAQGARLHVTVKGVPTGVTLKSSSFDIAASGDGLLITSTDWTTVTTEGSPEPAKFAHLKWRLSQGGKSMTMGWWN